MERCEPIGDTRYKRYDADQMPSYELWIWQFEAEEGPERLTRRGTAPNQRVEPALPIAKLNQKVQNETQLTAQEGGETLKF